MSKSIVEENPKMAALNAALEIKKLQGYENTEVLSIAKPIYYWLTSNEDSISLGKLESMLDDVLSKESPDTLITWLEGKRRQLEQK